MAASTDARLVDALGQATLTISAVLTSVAAEHDLSLTQLRVFGILRDRTLRMADLADYLGLERSTLSGLIDRAEKRGIVHRTRSREDGRAIEVTLSDAGRALAREAETAFADALDPLVARLSPADRGELATLLERMLA
ncbi:MarR family winged helix-turn-helix transcriptional regulator [Agromyces sp. MMS24-K17]|uniref:MarR family winged helix-turn-helix transcriptional regulator n=1 Tax=Agromyces sp. MMS24-K17 TaxID=3372850 RepID=UPI003753EF37